jgi:phosphate transport system protein
VRKAVHEHSSRDFETELRELRAHLLAMGARCERIVGLAFAGFRDGTSELMPEVTGIDAQIDRDEIEIHALILRILALRQPVADDLRFLATALRLITDLERIGDEAVNIAERAVTGEGAARHQVAEELGQLASAAVDMLHLALDAFVRGDDGLADQVMGADDDVDSRCASIITAMTAWMSQHGDEVLPGLRVIRVAKYLERIADHATNIAEEAIFIIRGDDVRHGSWHTVKRNGTDERPRVTPVGLRRSELPS